jgi:DNA adenine methylase
MSEYVKSPLNYTGGKYKLLSQILPLFPNNINTFVDLFGGGETISVNVSANNIYYNDICNQVYSILKGIKNTDLQNILCEINNYINKYNLSKENKDGYLQLRNDYNLNKNNWIELYVLICYSFNNQIRFNSKNEFNMPFGKNRSSFNPLLKEKFIEFSNQLKSKNIFFTNYSFDKLKLDKLSNKDFIYADPPYLNSDATYNELNGWNIEKEKFLLFLLDEANEKHINFALSNNLKYNNNILNKWKNKYNIHYLNINYSNCNYHKKDKKIEDKEILITNY